MKADVPRVVLAVLFAEVPALDAEALAAALVATDPSMARRSVAVELMDGVPAGTAAGRARWDGIDQAQITGLGWPSPSAATETVVEMALFGPDLKDAVRAHRACVIVGYAGDASDRRAAFGATLIAATAVAAMPGALVVANEQAHTSFPARAFVDLARKGGHDALMSFPRLLLACGFGKIEIEGVGGVWMRTFGAPAFGIPNLAMKATSHDQSADAMDVFSLVLDYVEGSGAVLRAGDTMTVAGRAVRLRAPVPGEKWLDIDAPVIVLEPGPS